MFISSNLLQVFVLFDNFPDLLNRNRYSRNYVIFTRLHRNWMDKKCDIIDCIHFYIISPNLKFIASVDCRKYGRLFWRVNPKKYCLDFSYLNTISRHPTSSADGTFLHSYFLLKKKVCVIVNYDSPFKKTKKKHHVYFIKY